MFICLSLSVSIEVFLIYMLMCMYLIKIYYWDVDLILFCTFYNQDYSKIMLRSSHIAGLL